MKWTTSWFCMVQYMLLFDIMMHTNGIMQSTSGLPYFLSCKLLRLLCKEQVKEVKGHTDTGLKLSSSTSVWAGKLRSCNMLATILHNPVLTTGTQKQEKSSVLKYSFIQISDSIDNNYTNIHLAL